LWRNTTIVVDIYHTTHPIYCKQVDHFLPQILSINVEFFDSAAFNSSSPNMP